jgi:hypothetical protein
MTVMLNQASAHSDSVSITDRLHELREKYPYRATEETVQTMGHATKEALRALIPELSAYPFSEVACFDDFINRAESRQDIIGIKVDTEVFAVLMCLEQVIPELLHRELMGTTITFADDEMEMALTH